MTAATSILMRARTQGGPTAGPVGFRPVPLDVGPPPMVSNLAAAAEASAPEPRELDEASVFLNAPLARNIAVLLVTPEATPNDRWTFKLQGLSSIEGINDFGPTVPLPQPAVVLADLAQEDNPHGAQPSQILGIMAGFSKEYREVPWWVNKLRAATEDDLHLIIRDYTGFEIPWELLTLPAGESGARTYLGAAVSTTRWQYILDSETFAERLPQWMHEEFAGRIAAFVDEQNLTEGLKEKEFLTSLHATVEKGLKEMVDRLNSPVTGFGLIYLACHCEPADTPFEYALGSPTTAGERLVLSSLNTMELQLFERSKAIVFINACHSGRMLKDSEFIRTGYLRGFPEVFLSKGAVGVIGTTGLVNDEFAARMARWLLQKLSTTEEPVSKLLRRWRAEVLKELQDKPLPKRSEEDYVPLLNACMYVYYGNPQSRLRIK